MVAVQQSPQQNLQQITLAVLEYQNSPGMQDLEELDQPSFKDNEISYIYEVDGNPVAYFSQLPDDGAILDLYLRVWNGSIAPLLYVFLPTEIRIYNLHSVPTDRASELEGGDRLLKSLKGLEDVLNVEEHIRESLDAYGRKQIDTGAFWVSEEAKNIKRENRADQRLLRSLDQTREKLIELGLSREIAHTLMSRIIFIQYLEDRRMLESDQIKRYTEGEAGTLKEVLEDKDRTYHFFRKLNEEFNGDLFIESKGESDVVDHKHLELMLNLLNGAVDRQLSFWPYNFRYIPIELISGIYEAFLRKSAVEEGAKDELGSGAKSSIGAYYTPTSLADFILRWTLPPMGPNTGNKTIKILDPACGSGIFLVRAFRWLVAKWQGENNKRPSVEDLHNILHDSIFGVDVDSTAIIVSKFSLYLAMLDHLTEIDFQRANFKFPSLDNLHGDVDFFSTDIDQLFGDIKFDRIVGNLPWGRGTLVGVAEKRAKSENYETPYGHAAPAFLLHMLRFCASDGEIAVLAPAVITLGGAAGVKFRSQFWQKADVRSIVNFSALVYELFDAARSPAVALFYSPKGETNKTDKILYGTPKPSSLSQYLGMIVLDSGEVKYLDRDEFQRESSSLWKIALWGTQRDASLIETLRAMGTLEKAAEDHHWLIGLGVTEANTDKAKGRVSPASKKIGWMSGYKSQGTNDIQPYVLDSSTWKDVSASAFERPRDERKFHAPLVLIRRSALGPIRRIMAAFSSERIMYKVNVIGVVGAEKDEWLLKWLTIYLNSSLAAYYLFLTSSAWAVERANMSQHEYCQMPFLVPAKDDPNLQQALKLFDDLSAQLRQDTMLQHDINKTAIDDLRSALDPLVFAIYKLTEQERQLVTDTLSYGIEFFYWSKQRTRKWGEMEPVKYPKLEMLEDYANAFTKAVSELLRYQEMTLNSTIYYNAEEREPLTAVSFDIVNVIEQRDVIVRQTEGEIKEILKRLDRRLISQHTQSLYTRRHIRIYSGRHIDLVQPSERRFWSRSQARADATSFIADLLSQSKLARGRKL